MLAHSTEKFCEIGKVYRSLSLFVNVGELMKKIAAFVLIFSIFLLPINHVNAVIENNDLNSGTGTSIRLTGEIVSEKLTDDIHTLGITVMLLSLNESATEIYDVRVDYRVTGHFSQYRPLSRLSVINSTTQADATFQYDSIWENCTLEMMVTYTENNTLTADPTFVSSWVLFFNLEPYVESTETPTATNPTTPSTQPDNGFDWGEHWYIFPAIGGGILLILVLVKVGTFLNHKRKMKKLQ